jgi:hypothetical protein
MTASKKTTIYKAINATAITTIIMIILVIYGNLYGEQKTQAKELSSVKEDVIVLKQTPVISQIVNNTALIQTQRKQIDINTKTLAILEIQYKNIEDKLDMIYTIVQDNNNKLDRHIEKEK